MTEHVNLKNKQGEMFTSRHYCRMCYRKQPNFLSKEEKRSNYNSALYTDFPNAMNPSATHAGSKDMTNMQSEMDCPKFLVYADIPQSSYLFDKQ